MKTPKNIYICSECGYESSKWLGKCPDCGSWNSFEEGASQNVSGTSKNVLISNVDARSEKIDEIVIPEYMRFKTGMSELDRVLGGGLVSGSVVLLSGEPGIGKSTLLLQICHSLAKSCKVLYISGEESKGQIKLRADRLGAKGEGINLLCATNLEAIINECNRQKPDVVIVDSIQTMYSERQNSTPGTVTQVRDCSMAYINFAKNSGAAVFLVGHVNKEGGISGPKILEHMVDAVLYFEGERRLSYRIIRAIKNRYGSTNEIGVFEMGDRGLSEVPNPSQMIMDGRPKNASGSCAGCMIEGSRPIICEIQTLVSQTTFPQPKRTSDGFDYNRMCLLIAVLEKRLGLKFSQNDVYLNIAGGMKLDEPAGDLAVAIALISGITDRVVPETLIAFGEVGLAGEVRSVSHIEYRVKEASRLGFTKILIPKRNATQNFKVPSGVEVIGIDGIYGALSHMIKKNETYR
ncbi:MAG: DNA repair protein RadA [Eubacteriales bacterium]|nr:DNA repair protein RadA [Eubacteriales bacterium]